MNRRRSIIGALVLCAIGICAFGASAASATTAYVCKEVVGGKFTDSHCKTAGEGSFETVAVTPGTETEGSPVTEGNTVISATIALTLFKGECKGGSLTGSGTGKNVEVGGEMRVEVHKVIGEITECSVLSPEPTKCKIQGGKVTGVSMVATTQPMTEAETTTKVKVTPESGTTFTTITLEGCGTAAFNGPKTITGSATGEIAASDPGLLVFSGTAGGELKLGGQTASLSGKGRSVMKGTEQTLVLKGP